MRSGCTIACLAGSVEQLPQVRGKTMLAHSEVATRLRIPADRRAPGMHRMLLGSPITSTVSSFT